MLGGLGLLVALAVPCLPGSRPALRRGAWSASAVLALLLGLTGLILLSTLVPAAVYLIPLLLLGGAGNAGLNTAAAVQLGRRVPEHARGRAYALYSGVLNGASALG